MYSIKDNYSSDPRKLTMRYRNFVLVYLVLYVGILVLHSIEKTAARNNQDKYESCSVDNCSKEAEEPECVTLSGFVGDHETEIHQNPCRRLFHSQKRSSVASGNDISLMNILSRGTDFLEHLKFVDEANLLLGNTGAGKTTAAKIITNYTSHLEAVYTASGNRMVIVDDNDKIGVPSTLSQTIIPDLYINPEDNAAFYDFPGFDDTRGPEQDIASNFFMNEVIKRVGKVKLLFIVVQSSVQLGNERLDFDLLMQHATKFVKSPENFKNSIGLVVTKVNNFDSFTGNILSDQQVTEDIVEFLQVYNQTLHTLLNSEKEKSKKLEILKKVELLQIFLKKDNTKSNHYPKISFIRNPEQCGLLNNSKSIRESRKRILKLYQSLEYGQIKDPRANFGYTLKDKTALNVHEYTKHVNEAISQAFRTLVKDFSEWYHAHKLEISNDMYEIQKTLQVDYTAIESLLESLENSSNDKDVNLLATARSFQETLSQVGYQVPRGFIKRMGTHNMLVDFFDEITGSTVTRNLKEWINELRVFQNELRYYKEWYTFCTELAFKMESYDFQLRKPSLSNGPVNWIDFLENNNMIGESNSQNIRIIAGRVPQDHLSVLEHIMKFGLGPTKVECLEGRIYIKGTFVRFSEVFNQHEFSICTAKGADVRRIDIFATRKIFIDANFHSESIKNMVVVGPQWQIIGQPHINLNGKDGLDFTPISAPSGGMGQNGFLGAPGYPGSPGGYFIGITSSIQNSETLKITANGGKGGRGQNGGNGGPGANGGDPGNAIGTFNGHPGAPGMNGDGGGVGGLGGYSGTVNIYSMGDAAITQNVMLETSPGQAGIPGDGGVGGEGGFPGEGVECTRRRVLGVRVGGRRCNRFPSPHPRAPNGQPGKSNSNSIGLPQPAPPNNLVDLSQVIIDYKRDNFYHPFSYKFIQDIVQNRNIQDECCTSLSYFLRELAVINRISLEGLHPSSIKLLYQLYLDFLNRISKAEFPNEKGHDRILTTLKAAASTKISVLKQSLSIDDFAGIGMIVDVDSYFSIVKEKIKEWETASAAVAITQVKEKFVEKITGKSDMVKSFIETIVTPALVDAETETVYQLNNFEKRHEDLVASRESEVNKKKEELKREEKEQRFKVLGNVSNIFKTFQSFGSFLTTASTLVGGGGSAATIIQTVEKGHRLLKTLQQNSGQAKNENSDKLKKDIENAERAINKAQQNHIFIQNNFVPIVKNVLNQLSNLDNRLQGKAGELFIERWNISAQLKVLKKNLNELETDISSKEILVGLNLIQECLNLMIDLYSLLEKHDETIRLADYIAAVAITPLQSTIHTDDPNILSDLAKIEENIKQNFVLEEGLKAMHAFKQWVFPFAKLYLNEFKLVESGGGGGDVVLKMANQVDQLKTQLDKYKAMTCSRQDTNLIQILFSSEHQSSRPFHSWKGSTWGKEIKDLLSGKQIHLYADVRHSGRGMDAVKFKQIEISFKWKGGDYGTSEEKEFQDTLKDFGVILTHSGISHYRFDSNFYVMTGESQTIRYHFEKDGNGNRMGRNVVYDKFKNGDYLLSPYTLWSMQIVRVASSLNGNIGGKSEKGRNIKAFHQLLSYADLVDLELVGSGIFVDTSDQGSDGDWKKLEVDTFFQPDKGYAKEMNF